MDHVALHRNWYFAGAAFIAYLILMFTNPVRRSLRDGFRCLQRYRTIWGILTVFGFCYAAFQLGLRIFYYLFLPEGQRPPFHWNRAWFLDSATFLEIVKESGLLALEGVAGIFNNMVTTYPFSAVAGLLLLLNWQGHNAVLNRAVRRRYGLSGWLIYFFICLTAVAAVLKPLMYLTLPAFNVLELSLIIDWLSFLFEYLFGVCVQVYLILLVYVWVRGLNYTPTHLLDFAIRRFSYVMKWAFRVLLISTIFIDLPRLLTTIPAFNSLLPDGVTFTSVDAYINRIARPLLALFLIGFASVQITLTFHSESYRKAIADHLLFLRKNWWCFSWLLIIATLHFFLLHLLNQSLLRGYGEGTAIIVVWSLFFPMLAALMGGWFLAAWVCVYKRCDTGRSQTEDWIKF